MQHLHCYLTGTRSCLWGWRFGGRSTNTWGWRREGGGNAASGRNRDMEIMQISSLSFSSAGRCSPHSGMLCKSWSKWDHFLGCGSKEIKPGAKANRARVSWTITPPSSASNWFLKSATVRHRLNTLDKI